MLDNKVIKNKPISEYMHYWTTKALVRHNVKTVVDIGGVGKLDQQFEVTNANIRSGIDGTNLPYSSNSFDASVSIATLEHVKNQILFLQEAVRVAKLVSTHWFHYGKTSQRVEDLKRELGHIHPCKLLEEEELKQFLLSIQLPYTITPVVTCREHLLMLATLYPKLNKMKLYDFLYDTKPDEYCGILLEITVG